MSLSLALLASSCSLCHASVLTLCRLLLVQRWTVVTERDRRCSVTRCPGTTPKADDRPRTPSWWPRSGCPRTPRSQISSTWLRTPATTDCKPAVQDVDLGKPAESDFWLLTPVTADRKPAVQSLDLGGTHRVSLRQPGCVLQQLLTANRWYKFWIQEHITRFRPHRPGCVLQ